MLFFSQISDSKYSVIFICLIAFIAIAIIIFIAMYKHYQHKKSWKKSGEFSSVKNNMSKCRAMIFDCSSCLNSTSNQNKSIKSEVAAKNNEFKKKIEKPSIVKGVLISTTNEYIQKNLH